VNDVAPEIDAKVASDGSWQRLLRIRLSHHHATRLSRVLPLPYHGDDGTGRDKVDEFVVERFILQVDVVLLYVLFRSLHELHSDELEAALFESLDDVADESALDSVGLHHDESAVRVRHGRLRMRVIKSKHKMIF